ncbi:MAG: septum formation family protein [Actinobacteria bacterium]|nr:septum formation family protein [Actinomycetota bacterium]
MRTRNGLITLFLAAALALAGACGDDEPTRDESGSISETDDVTPNSLQVGDCFNDPDESATEVTSLEAVPCDEPHDNEIFHVFDLEGDDFPGEDEVKRLGMEGCEAEFEGYVGTPLAESGLAIVPVTPTEGSWESTDDRTILCAAYNSDGAPLTGSVEGRGAAAPAGEGGAPPGEPAPEDGSAPEGDAPQG